MFPDEKLDSFFLLSQRASQKASENFEEYVI